MAPPTQRQERVLSPDTPDQPKGVEWGRSESQQEEYYGKLLPHRLRWPHPRRDRGGSSAQIHPTSPRGWSGAGLRVSKKNITVSHFWILTLKKFENIMSRVVRKPAFCYVKTKTQISFAVIVKLISAFVFATWIVQSRFCLNAKFQASSHLLWLYSLVCVGPGRKPRRPVFSQRGSSDSFRFTHV